jgi:hypothetical protein
MGRQFLKYGAGLIGVYLLVAYATGSGRVLSAGAQGASNVVKAFQGR